jgi:FKBP-type peptidyl-prolyl cis-trans isomerase FklB
MRRRLATSSVLVLLALSAACHKQAAERKLGADTKQRQSYSLGYKLGTSLQRQNTSIELEAYVLGLREALANAPSQVTESEMRMAVTGLRDRAMSAQKAQDKTKAAANLAAGRAFLDDNRKKAGVQILPSGLQYKVLQPGDGRGPHIGDVVVVNYRGALVDGTEFANTYKRKNPVVMTLDQVIPAWKEALPLMKESAKWQLVVPAELAYGSKGGPGIGPDSTLVFEIELLGVRPKASPQATASFVK